MSDAGIGLQHWEARRAAWCRVPSTWTPETLAARRKRGMVFPSLKADGSGGPTRQQLDVIYEKAVIRPHKLTRNVNLGNFMPVLKHGWIKDGFWPQDGRNPDASP